MAGLIVFSDTIEPDAQADDRFHGGEWHRREDGHGDNRSIARKFPPAWFYGSIIEKKRPWGSRKTGMVEGRLRTGSVAERTTIAEEAEISGCVDRRRRK